MIRRTRLERGASQLARRARLERKAPVAGRGRRRPELDVDDATRTLLAWRSRGRCEAMLYDAGCTQDAGDVHHRKRRRDGGHALSNLVHLCRSCHAWAHANPAAARELGLIVSAYEDPAAVRVRLLSHLTGLRVPVLLDELGGYLVDATAIAEAQR